MTLFLTTFLLSNVNVVIAKENWEKFTGQEGATGWKCHVIFPDSEDDGPDGINWHDWDKDGQLDLFVNYEEGKKSRLYFNPGINKVTQVWNDYIEFNHTKCEDSGIGDLDNDGDIDYIANGGQIYFNPGKSKVREKQEWQKMILFKEEARVPVVTDIDQDGMNDLLVAGNRWYKQPLKNKHDPSKWKEFKLGHAKWAMNNIHYDVDKDGLKDIVVQDRKAEVFWYKNPGLKDIYKPWPRVQIYDNKESMFMMIADVNQDSIDDYIITGGRVGALQKKLLILINEAKKGKPKFKEIILDQPDMGFEGIDYFPKGVAYFDVDGDPSQKEIVVLPKKGDAWYVTYEGISKSVEGWKTHAIPLPGSLTRFKMDNIYPCDIDGDGDLDFATTEENSGWGVLWFENSSMKK